MDFWDRIANLEEELTRLLMRLAELERKQDNTIRHGKVTDVDAKKHLARIEIGERDGTPLKSAWVPYGQFAGAYKAHRPPTVGQQMTMFAPNGEARQAVLLPMTWSDQNKSPSDQPDEHVTTFGKLKIVEKADSYTISIDDKATLSLTTSAATLKFGSAEVEIVDGKVNVTAPTVSVAGATYIGQRDKGRTEGPVIITDGGPAERAYAKVG